MTLRLCSTTLRAEHREVLQDSTQALTGGMSQKAHAILLSPRQSCLRRRVSTFRGRLPPHTRQHLDILDRHLQAIRRPMRLDALLTTHWFLRVEL
jgi:hypothetical protein